MASRSFVVADHRRRSVVSGVEIAAGLDCDRCARPRSLTVYEVDAGVPVWLDGPDLRWCGPCGHGVINPYFQPQPVHQDPDHAPVIASPEAGERGDTALAAARDVRRVRRAAGTAVWVLAGAAVAGLSAYCYRRRSL